MPTLLIYLIQKSHESRLMMMGSPARLGVPSLVIECSIMMLIGVDDDDAVIVVVGGGPEVESVARVVAVCAVVARFIMHTNKITGTRDDDERVDDDDGDDVDQMPFNLH